MKLTHTRNAKKEDIEKFNANWVITKDSRTTNKIKADL